MIFLKNFNLWIIYSEMFYLTYFFKQRKIKRIIKKLLKLFFDLNYPKSLNQWFSKD